MKYGGNEESWSADADYLAGLTLLREKYKMANENDDFYIMYKCLINWFNDILHDTPQKDNRLEVIKRVQQILNWYLTIRKEYPSRQYPEEVKIKIEWKFGVAYKLLMSETALQNKLYKQYEKRLMSMRPT